tara:strand:+ start:254 stop:1072 length:819 start_codon:yes stop_codon:yes gene_type:complete
MKNNCKIVTSYFGPRRTYPRNYEESVDLFKKMFSYDSKVDAGIKHDTVIVNHLTADESVNNKVKKLLLDYDGAETKNGPVKIIHRPHENGEGIGFKSRQYAYDKYKDDYEFWFFAEDDYNFFYDFYYKKCIDVLKQNKNTAFICTQHNEVGLRKNHNDSDHCHGGMGCTHIKYLNKMVEFYGRLPYSTMEDAGNEERSGRAYKAAEVWGEVAFTNVFLQMGYDLRAIEGQHNEKEYYPDAFGSWITRRARRRLSSYREGRGDDPLFSKGIDK